MLRIVLVSSRIQAWQSFAAALTSNPEVQVKQVASGAEVLAAVPADPPHLVIIDSELPDAAPLDLVKKLLLVNAMVNTAVVSSLAEPEFHEASEGLGVLARLPEEPGAREAADLLGRLKTVVGIGG